MFHGLLDLLRRSRWGFEWRYLRGQTPWDTNITPPEVMEFVAQHPPGKALDLGCGTGTNAITLAKNGWKVTAVDISAKAIARARDKARAAGLEIQFLRADVTDLSMLRDSYDYALDIGCLLGLGKKARARYARELARLVRTGGWYMLYAWLPRKWRGSTWGMSQEEVDCLFDPHFSKMRQVMGQERGFPSAWYWFQRRSI
ncbi:MAG: methyltransferase domain-containing protein [bacterium]